MRITIVDANRDFTSIDLDPALEYTIGRGKGCTIALRSGLASRLHCLLVHRDDTAAPGGAWHLVDNQSTNGTLLNGKKILDAIVHNYDVAKVGDVMIEFCDDALISSIRFEGPDENELKVVSDLLRNVRDAFLAFKRGANESNFKTEVGSFEGKLAGGLREFTQATTRMNREMKVLLELTKSIAEIFNLKELMNVALDLANEVRNAERGLVLLIDAKTGAFLPYVSRRMSAGDLDLEKNPVSTTILEEARRTEAPILIENSLHDERFASAESVVALKGKSILVIPLVSKHGLQGVFYLEKGVDNPFTAEDAAFLRNFAQSVSVAIDNARLMATVRREKNIRNNMERYISPNLIEQLETTQGGLKLDGEKRMITVFFADIKNFTTMSEKLAVEQVFAMLNRVFTGISEIIFRHDGTLDKFIGDCVMAFFGAPARHDDDPLRAVTTCIETVAFVRELATGFKAELGIDLGISIGINTGEAIIGNVGSLERMEYTAIGDTVNVAARLQAAAGFNEIVVNETVYEAVRDRYECVAIGECFVKGRELPVRAFKVKL